MNPVLDLDLTVTLARFELRARWRTDALRLGVFGPSGAGKTTLLSALAGLQPAARGRIEVNGVTWLDTSRGTRRPPEERGIGYVPQEGLLFPHRDVRGNLQAGRARAARATAPQPSFDRVVSVLELAPLLARSVAGLSGGERQRVALGRALLSGPALLLMDEPLAGLDLPLRRRILPYLVRAAAEFNLPALLVSHDPAEIQILCREVLVLDGGRAVDQGPPDRLFTTPAVFALARAEGFENLLRGTIVEAQGSTCTVRLAGGDTLMATRAQGGAAWPAEADETPGSAGRIAAGGQAMVGVRSEDLILAVEPVRGLSAQNLLAGRIARIEREPGEGGQVMVVVEVGTPATPVVVAITARAMEQLGLSPGLAVCLVAKAQACHLLAML